MNEIEGVIKYRLDFVETDAPDAPVEELNVWRAILFGLGLIGQRADRYGGAGYGNVSRRHAARDMQMVISASQTGGLARLDEGHYSVVESVDIERNWVQAHGRLPPSSEVLTHAVLYQLDPAIQAVFHIHDPRLWRYALDNDFPATGAEIEYGTVEMARAMERLYRDGLANQRGVLAMRGHEDGVLAFGSSLEQAGARILRLWTDARLD